MGLPLAPEIARMCTAFLLKDYQPPTNHSLTIYFDDVASTYPPTDLPLETYNLKTTEANQTQDAIHEPEKKIFRPFSQPYRQPVLLHPHSHHPSQKMCEKTYFGSAFRATQIGTDASDTLEYLLTKYLPTLHRLGHNATEVAINQTEISYFPVRTEKKDFGPYKPSITYSYSGTRPIHSQLKPMQKQDFKLVPNLPPLKALQNYTPPQKSKAHTVYPCQSYSCNIFRIIDATLQVPIIPCTRLRCPYLIFFTNPNERRHFQIGTTNMEQTNIQASLHLNTVQRHLFHENTSWKLLALYLSCNVQTRTKQNRRKTTRLDKEIAEEIPGLDNTYN